MKIVALLFAAISVVAVLACAGESQPPADTPAVSEPPPNIAATVEAGIAATKVADQSVEATITASVKATKEAEPAPDPTPTPSPTQTPQPTPTSMPSPTVAPTQRPIPTPTAVPTTAERRLTGNWYANADWEHSLANIIREIDPTTAYEIRVATLDATPDSPDQDLAFSLGCIGPTQVAYLSPYSGEILDYVNTFVFGIWDASDSAYLANHENIYSSPVLTDDGSSIYITNIAQLRQILATLTFAADGLETGHLLIAGMWESDNDTVVGLWSEFDPAGIDDAIRYLGCLPDVSITGGTHPPTSAALKDYADRHAGGLGAIYVGDLSQLQGPAPSWELGDGDGNVPFYAINQHLWIYETDYYQSLLEKARLTNPTLLTSSPSEY